MRVASFTISLQRCIDESLSACPVPLFLVSHFMASPYIINGWIQTNRRCTYFSFSCLVFILLFLLFLFFCFYFIFIHSFFYLVIKICNYISFRLLLCLVFSLASAAGSLGEGGRRNKKYKQSITRLIAKREREREQSYSVG